MNIKECPCCGGKARTSIAGEIDGAIYKAVVCTKCGIRTDGYRNIEKAIEIWNTRHDATMAERELERIEEELKRVPTRAISVVKVLQMFRKEQK